MDAFASDFCEPGVWEKQRGKASRPLTEIASTLTGQRLAHLTYHRQELSADAKQWPVGDVCFEIIEGIGSLVSLARVGSVDLETMEALMNPQSHFPGVGPPSVGLGGYFESDSVQGLEIGS